MDDQRSAVLISGRDRLLLYIFFWVFPRRQIVVGRRFGTLHHFHLQRLGVQCDVGQLQFDAGEIPRRKYTIFKSRRKSEIKNRLLCFPEAPDWLLGPPSCYQRGTVASALHSPIHLHGMV